MKLLQKIYLLVSKKKMVTRKIVETHIPCILLTRSVVYKIKKKRDLKIFSISRLELGKNIFQILIHCVPDLTCSRFDSSKDFNLLLERRVRSRSVSFRFSLSNNRSQWDNFIRIIVHEHYCIM